MLTKPSISENFEGVALSPIIKELQKYDFVCTIGYDDHSDTIYDHAFPIHQQYDAPGTFYIISGRVESGDRTFGMDSGAPSQWGEVVTWEQLREMHHSPVGAISVQNHTHTHPTLGTLTEEDLFHEFDESQKIFKKRGFNPKYISYPFGSTSELVRHYASAFFESGRSTDYAKWNNQESNKFHTRAMAIDATSIAEIKNEIDKARSNGEWIDLYGHAVTPSGLTDQGTGCVSTDKLEDIILYVKENNGIILSLDDVINAYMKNFQWTNHNIFKASL